MKMKKFLKKKNQLNSKISWFNWKYIVTLKNMAEQSISQEFRFKFFTWRNRAKLIDE